MRRRELIKLSVIAAAWPLVAHAQPVRRIGCLVTGTPQSHGQFVAAFRQRLNELGYVEPRDFILS
jgi:putative ABC transport system substrate-binding protein